MRTIIVGKGIQGLKRQKYCSDVFIGFVDPKYNQNDYFLYGRVQEVPLDSYDVAIVCVPYAEQEAILHYLLTNGKHVMVEKPLVLKPGMYAALETVALANNAVLYTAYNHRFEPHLLRMKYMLESGDLGQIYSVRMFYGNGTAQNVKGTWRDQSILHEIGSHMFDLLKWWNGTLPMPKQATFSRSETDTCDYVSVQLGDAGTAPVLLEMTWLSWRNTFTCDIIGSKGSAHIDGLCKWGPSTFTHRTRVYPSGKPEEDKVVLEHPDTTWAAEYTYFKSLIDLGQLPDLSWDAELQALITELEKDLK